MTTIRTAARTLARAASLGALALAANASFAGATLNITGFSVTTDGVLFVEPKYAFATYATSDLTLMSMDAGGLLGSASNAYTADAWDNSNNIVANTTFASAFGNTVTFTDNATQLVTGGFNLVSSAQQGTAPQIAPPSTANASGLQSGFFTLIDGNGAPVAGMLTFDVFYEISITGPAPGSALDFSMSTLTFSASGATGGNSFTDQLNSANLTGGVGSVNNGHFTITLTMAAGDVASYSLSGTAFSSASVTAVPEPATWAFAAMGLAFIGVAARRRKQEDR